MIEQIFITLLSGTAILLVNLPIESLNKYRRYACFFGLAGQPFWLYTATVNDQWGILILALFYTCCWAMGCYRDWLKPCLDKRKWKK